MKIMNEYTYEHLKKNKRHTISILVAIIIASSLLCSLSIFIYSMWKGKVDTAISQTGYWHGELADSIAGDKLKDIEKNPEVETAMVKGTWVTAKLSNTKRPYLLMRDANKAFWENMNYKDGVMEGRLPENPDEIVISKIFFADNPQYNVGDKITLPIGKRMINDKELDTQSLKEEGETFKETGSKKYTIVGKLDLGGISAFPGYISMGYLDENNLKPDDDLTVYMNFKNPRKIYDELPKVAESAGLTKDLNGKYKLTYNTKLLSLYGISDKNASNTEFIAIIAIAVIMLSLVIGAFVLIIYNAFSLSANSRIKELSTLKSLGATPKQIKCSVLYEGFLLWLIQLPVGLLVGYGFTYAVFSKVNKILSLSEDYQNMSVCFSWIEILVSVIISLITVLISAYIPARKVAKVSAISGIRQNDEKIKIKKQKNHFINRKLFGIEGELAGTQFSANKKSLRTAILSLAMCFILISGYFNVVSIYNLAESKNENDITHDLSVNLNILDEPDKEMINKITSLSQVKDSVIRRQVRTSTLVSKDDECDVFKSLGGFESRNSKHQQSITEENGGYRIIINLVGLGDDSFKKYCDEIGTNYNEYYREGKKGILVNKTYHTDPDSKEMIEIPFLNTSVGNQMILEEKIDDDTDTNNSFNIGIGEVTDKSPSDLKTGWYDSDLIIPMSSYKDIVSSFSSKRGLEDSIMSIDLQVGDEASPKVKRELTDICNSYLGSEDFDIWSLLEEKNHHELVQEAYAAAITAIAVMIGMIGIFNAFSIVSNNMRLRRREFAMLRSVGLTPKGLNKMLTLEGLFFAIKPIVISIPVIYAICCVMLKLTLIKWNEFINVFPGRLIFVYAMLIFSSILLSYCFSSRSVKKSNIIESIKDELL